jgi:hypothetical protein
MMRHGRKLQNAAAPLHLPGYDASGMPNDDENSKEAADPNAAHVGLIAFAKPQDRCNAAKITSRWQLLRHHRDVGVRVAQPCQV